MQQRKKCIICNKEFSCRTKTAKYCSVKCTPYYEKNKLKYLLKAYNLTTTEHQNLILNSKNKCTICGNTGELKIDHNHITNKIRGLLCNTCNTCLRGIIWDDQKMAKITWDYLQKGF